MVVSPSRLLDTLEIGLHEYMTHIFTAARGATINRAEAILTGVRGMLDGLDPRLLALDLAVSGVLERLRYIESAVMHPDVGSS